MRDKRKMSLQDARDEAKFRISINAEGGMGDEPSSPRLDQVHESTKTTFIIIVSTYTYAHVCMPLYVCVYIHRLFTRRRDGVSIHALRI
jgi:hypothetical protein